MSDTFSLGGELLVPRVGFGAMRLCGPNALGPPPDRERAVRVLQRTDELGIRLIDTADAYGPFENETLIAEALGMYRADLVVATKGGFTRPDGRWVPDGRPEHLRAACEGSLQRLRLDAIDLYQLHAPDPRVPFAESLGALAELRRAGKIRHIGLSNVDVEQLEAAHAIAAVASVQNRYNVGFRRDDAVVDACERHGIAFLPWAPLDRGDLAKKGALLARVAAAHGATDRQIALAWLLRRSPVVLPIPGTSSIEHLEENLFARTIVLSDGEYEALAA